MNTWPVERFGCQAQSRSYCSAFRLFRIGFSTLQLVIADGGGAANGNDRHRFSDCHGFETVAAALEDDGSLGTDSAHALRQGVEWVGESAFLRGASVVEVHINRSEKVLEFVDETGAIGGAPAGAEVVAHGGAELTGAAGPEVVADGGVVETGIVDALATDDVKGRSGKSDSWPAAGGGLLVDHGGKGRPKRRGDTCAFKVPR